MSERKKDLVSVYPCLLIAGWDFFCQKKSIYIYSFFFLLGSSIPPVWGSKKDLGGVDSFFCVPSVTLLPVIPLFSAFHATNNVLPARPPFRWPCPPVQLTHRLTSPYCPLTQSYLLRCTPLLLPRIPFFRRT